MSILTLSKNGTSKKTDQPTIFKTSDYGKFKILNANRDVNRPHVDRLKKSFQDKYLFTVITVNEKLEIIDGQHRYTAAKELGLPIYYSIIENYGVREIQALNTNQSNWKKTDYLKSYTAEGNESYRELQEFMKAFPDFGIKVSIRLLTGMSEGSNSSRLRDFENGKFALGNVTKAYIHARKIMEFKEYYSGFNRPTFVGAVLPLFSKSRYDHKRMMHKIKCSPIKLDKCATVEQYRLLLQKIYNYKTSADDRADFINV